MSNKAKEPRAFAAFPQFNIFPVAPHIQVNDSYFLFGIFDVITRVACRVELRHLTVPTSPNTPTAPTDTTDQRKENEREKQTEIVHMTEIETDNEEEAIEIDREGMSVIVMLEIRDHGVGVRSGRGTMIVVSLVVNLFPSFNHNSIDERSETGSPRDYERPSRGGHRDGDSGRGVGGGRGGRGREYGPNIVGKRYDSRRGGREEERPLDRRAIEEGRRRREEERANGTVHADEPKAVPTGMSPSLFLSLSLHPVEQVWLMR